MLSGFTYNGVNRKPCDVFTRMIGIETTLETQAFHFELNALIKNDFIVFCYLHLNSQKVSLVPYGTKYIVKVAMAQITMNIKSVRRTQTCGKV